MAISMAGTVLLIPAKADAERDAVAAAWEAAGGAVLRIGKFWERPETGGLRPVIYGNDTFAQVLAQVMGSALQSPADEWIVQLPARWVSRKIELLRLGELGQMRFPRFMKPVQPKLFPAGIYGHPMALAEATEGLEADVQVIVSEVLHLQAEVRVWVHAGTIADLCVYEGAADRAEARAFATAFLSEFDAGGLQAYVLDLGYAQGLGWLVIEFNAAWGAGLNGCDPTAVLPCIAAACK